MEEAARLFQPLGAQRLGDHVYRHLIEAIATSRLPQGAKIQEDVLAAQMGVSKTPIREALRRLETEGFIKVDPHRTPEVRRLEPSDIQDLYSIREYLERLAVRAVAQRRPADVVAGLEAVQTPAEARLAKGSPITIADSVAYNQRFHGLIFEGAMNLRLLRMFHLIDVDVRRLSYQSVSITGRQRDAIVQHRAILAAIKAGDPDLAERLIAKHIQQARDDLLKQFA
jgi:DNA-binding GntR family transcriptional regulator